MSTWLRMEYPNIFWSTFAMSTPLLQSGDKISPYRHFQEITRIYKDASVDANVPCDAKLKQALELLDKTTDFASLKTKFSLCEEVTAEGKVQLYFAIKNALEQISYYNYPYEASVYIKLPANPVKEVCSKFSATDATLDQLAAAFKIYQVMDPEAKCYKLYGPTPDATEASRLNALNCYQVY